METQFQPPLEFDITLGELQHVVNAYERLDLFPLSREQAEAMLEKRTRVVRWLKAEGRWRADVTQWLGAERRYQERQRLAVDPLMLRVAAAYQAILAVTPNMDGGKPFMELPSAIQARYLTFARAVLDEG